MADIMYYSSSEVYMSILGKTMEGFAEDTFISIEPQEDSFKMKTSMDGLVQVSGIPAHIHNVTLSLQQTSPVNTLLHALFILHRKFGTKLRIPLLIRDDSTGTSFYASEVWFKTEPTLTFGANMNILQWQFMTKNAVYKINGNGSEDTSSDILQMVSEATQLAGLLNIDLDTMLGTASDLFTTVTNIF